MRNQLKFGVVLSYIGLGLDMLMHLFYTPIMIKYLGKSEFGLYTLIMSAVSWLNLLTLGFGGAYGRFYTKAEAEGGKRDTAKINGMFIIIFFIAGAVAFALGISLAQIPRQVFGSKLADFELETAKKLMYLLVFNTSLSIIAAPLSGVVVLHERFIFANTLTIVSLILRFCITLPLLFCGFRSVGVVVVISLLTIARVLCILFYFVKVLKEPVSFERFNFALLKDIAVFSLFIFMNQITGLVNTSADKYILGRVSGTSAIAVYGVAFQIFSIVSMLSGSVAGVFGPRVNRIAAYKKRERETFTDLFIRVGRIQFLVLALIISGFIIFGRPFILGYYAGRGYEDSYPTAIILIVSALVPYIQNIGVGMLQAKNMHKARAVLYLIMAVVNVIISFPLAVKYGAIGSAIGTAIVTLFADGIYMNIYYSKRLGIDIKSFWANILSLSKGLIAPVIFGAYILAFGPASTQTNFIVLVAVYTLLYAASMYTLGMSCDEKKLARDVLKKARSVLRF